MIHTHKRSDVHAHNYGIILPCDFFFEQIEQFRNDEEKTTDRYCFNEFEINIERCDMMHTLHKADPNHTLMDSILKRAEYCYKDIHDNIPATLSVDVMQKLYRVCKEALIWKCSKDCKIQILKVQILNSCCPYPSCPLYKFSKLLLDAFRLYSILDVQ